MSKLSMLLTKHGKTIASVHRDLVRSGKDISLQTLYNVQNGDNVKINTARMLADYFNVTIDEVVG